MKKIIILLVGLGAMIWVSGAITASIKSYCCYQKGTNGDYYLASTPGGCIFELPKNVICAKPQTQITKCPLDPVSFDQCASNSLSCGKWVTHLTCR